MSQNVSSSASGKSKATKSVKKTPAIQRYLLMPNFFIYKRANGYTSGHHLHKCPKKDKNDSDNLYQAYDKWKAKQNV